MPKEPPANPPTSSTMAGQVEAYLNGQSAAHPELAEHFTVMADLYTRRLWHQLTMKLEAAVALPEFQVAPMPTAPECTETHAHSPRRTFTLPTPGVTAPPHFRGGRRHRGCGGALDPGRNTAPATFNQPDLIPLQSPFQRAL